MLILQTCEPIRREKIVQACPLQPNLTKEELSHVRRLELYIAVGAIVTLADVVHAIADGGGYIAPRLQDVMLQIFGDTGYSRELDANADAFRRNL